MEVLSGDVVMSADKMRRRGLIQSVISWIFFGAFGVSLLACFVMDTMGKPLPLAVTTLGLFGLSVGGFLFRQLAKNSKAPDGHDGARSG